MEFEQNKGSFESDEDILDKAKSGQPAANIVDDDDPMRHMADAPDGDNISVDQPSEFIEHDEQKNPKMAASIVL